MKIKPLGRGVIAFTTTNDCTARCAHCLMCCEPGLKHYLNADQIIDAIEQANKMEKIRVAIFTGGESLLLGNDLIRAIEYCYNNKILTRLITNAFWADTPKHAEWMLSYLRSCGLLELNISFDDYHAEYVPEQNIVNVWNAVQGKHFTSVVFANCSGENSRITPEYIQKLIGTDIEIIRTEERFRDLDYAKRATKIDGTDYYIVQNNLQRTGRAAEEIKGDENYKAYLTDDELKVIRCNNILHDTTIGYNYHVNACCGIKPDGNPVLDLGDLSKEPLADILNRAANSVIINAIHHAGPYCLRMFVQEKDPTVQFKEKYTSVCEICEDVTTNPRAMEVIRANINELYVVMKAYKKVVDDAIKEAERIKAESAGSC